MSHELNLAINSVAIENFQLFETQRTITQMLECYKNRRFLKSELK